MDLPASIWGLLHERCAEDVASKLFVSSGDDFVNASADVVGTAENGKDADTRPLFRGGKEMPK